MSDDNPSAASSPTISLELAVEPGNGSEAGEGAEERPPSVVDGWWPEFEPVLRRLWAAEAPQRGGEIAVVLVAPERIHELNRQFLDRDKPTDVLSFDLSEDPDEVEGEVYVSLDVAAKQAERASVSLKEETARLLVHGLLHLAGHDHHSPADGRRMAKATRTWLGELFPGGGSPSPDT